MTDTDADTLKGWLETLTTTQLAALWRWVTIYYMHRLERAFKER